MATSYFGGNYFGGQYFTSGVVPALSWWAWELYSKPLGEGMFKNTAGQKWTLLAIDTATNLPKTEDAANITAYVSKDDGTVTALTDTSVTEKSATNAPGQYTVDVTQGESDAIKLDFSGKSSTAGVSVIPATIYTRSATEVADLAAMKLKIDQLTYTLPNQLDVNARWINDTPVLGNGTSGNKWRG